MHNTLAAGEKLIQQNSDSSSNKNECACVTIKKRAAAVALHITDIKKSYVHLYGRIFYTHNVLAYMNMCTPV